MKLQCALVTVMLSLCATCLMARADATSIEGTWINPDKDTGGIAKVVISRDGNRYSIEAWGKCHPVDCEWGKVVLHPVASAPGAQDSTYGFATWEPTNMTEHIFIHIDPTYPNGQLLIQTITIFKDDSKRSNFRALYLLQKKVAVEKPAQPTARPYGSPAAGSPSGQP